ncbi:hypothetical protein PV327_011189 [Microctonus hyperodae]|uniref:BEN domain-containing protein n=1 Tax=Microctonus hyperodae TaxID=165561 RepID=A0AA39C5N3_MICHY|nr:hypothetical protein PV327_011189 [Microctonus hyperodae]
MNARKLHVDDSTNVSNDPTDKVSHSHLLTALRKDTEKENQKEISNARKLHVDDSTNVSHDPTDKVNHSHLMPKNNEVAKCSVCNSLPQRNHVEFFQNALCHSQKSAESTSNSVVCAVESAEIHDILPHWKIPEFGKIELGKKSGLWLKESEIDFITYNTSSQNPNEAIRKLFKLTLGEQNIHKYCAVGSKNTSKMGIPCWDSTNNSDLKTAIFKFVKKTFPICNMDKFNRVINLMCSSAAIKIANRKSLQSKPDESLTSKQLYEDEIYSHPLRTTQQPPQMMPEEQQLFAQNENMHPPGDNMFGFINLLPL